MKPNTKISVVIPVLNNKDNFSRAIKSIIEQEDDIEIIVIDGGSTDGTLEELEKYQTQIAYFETGIDTGICDAFNRGISRATGDIIGILNSDDFWNRDTISILNETINKYPLADVYYGALRFVDKENRYSYIRTPDLSLIKKRMTIFHPSMFIRKVAYKRNGLYNMKFRYAMDSEWCHRAIQNQLVFREVGAVLANMSLGGHSDVNFIQSLNEYRRSVILHKLASPLVATVNFVFYSTVKLFMRSRLVLPIKKYRDNYLKMQRDSFENRD